MPRVHAEDKAWVAIGSFFSREKRLSCFHLFVSIIEITYPPKRLRGAMGPREAVSLRLPQAEM